MRARFQYDKKLLWEKFSTQPAAPSYFNSLKVWIFPGEGGTPLLIFLDMSSHQPFTSHIVYILLTILVWNRVRFVHSGLEFDYGF